jgi:hypothetical protein
VISITPLIKSYSPAIEFATKSPSVSVRVDTGTLENVIDLSGTPEYAILSSMPLFSIAIGKSIAEASHL